MHYIGFLIMFFTTVGLYRAYRLLPEVTIMPEMFFIVLMGVSCLGVIYHKKNYKSMYYITTFIFITTWIFIQSTFLGVLAFSTRVTSSQYVKYEAIDVATKIAYSPLIIGIVFLLISFRLLRSLQVADPMYESSDDNTNTRQFLKSFKQTKAKLVAAYWRIRDTWQIEEMDEKGNTKKPYVKILKKTIKIILNPECEAPYKDYELEICTDTTSQEKMKLGFFEIFLHMLIVGPTGCGKTSRVIKPIAWQIIKFVIKYHQKTGKKFGLTIVEPKGDLAEDVAHWCKKLNIPHVHVDPLNPNSAKINPLQGDAQVAAESTRMVLRKLFGKQDAFFAQVQETAARNVILLLKKIKGDQLDLGDVIRTLRDPENLKSLVHQLEQKEGQTDLVQYFQYELLGSLKDKYQQFAMGLRMQLEDLMGNDMLKNVITGDSDIHFDQHLEDGGILLVNTAMGQLGKLGDAFGSFVVMHLQNAVFRRDGNEWTRTPHVLIIDEAPRYINPDFERLLAIGRSFRCSCILAIQSLGQLQLEEKMAFANIVLTNCRNKIVFGGLEEADAQKFEREFGKIEKSMVQPTYDHKKVVPNIFPKNFRLTRQLEPRFSYTEIIELDEYTFLYRLIKGSGYLEPGIGESSLVTKEVVDRLSKELEINRINTQPSLEPVKPTIEKVESKTPAEHYKSNISRIKFIPPTKKRNESDKKAKDINKTAVPVKEPTDKKQTPVNKSHRPKNLDKETEAKRTLPVKPTGTASPIVDNANKQNNLSTPNTHDNNQSSDDFWSALSNEQKKI